MSVNLCGQQLNYVVSAAKAIKANAADNDAQLESGREREREAEQLRKQTTPRATKRTNYANQFRMQDEAGGLALLLDGAANVP